MEDKLLFRRQQTEASLNLLDVGRLVETHLFLVIDGRVSPDPGLVGESLGRGRSDDVVVSTVKEREDSVGVRAKMRRTRG